MYRDNHLVATLPLDRDAALEVAGRLGPVRIETHGGQARLLEHRSARMIGTRTGWIGSSGRVAVCVPCGVLVKITGNAATRGADDPNAFDAIAQ
ncbi:hypothetical protein MAIT1_01312 [Magnetofaba australis IT-1]|uniref:Uncharacterized protein n=1 Tax=Magnetofaba australis IT-1 TaxID=1434232 RepID=A0A1Y2K2G3_9PROT|nr:hypothetical protein MAIT1_01312 [Magnetofaba australis IT-1]